MNYIFNDFSTIHMVNNHTYYKLNLFLDYLVMENKKMDVYGFK